MARKVARQYDSSEDAIQDMAAGITAGGGAIDSTGATIFPDAFAQVFTYNGDNTLAAVAFTDGTNTWTQSYSYTSGNLTGVSMWVKS